MKIITLCKRRGRNSSRGIARCWSIIQITTTTSQRTIEMIITTPLSKSITMGQSHVCDVLVASMILAAVAIDAIATTTLIACRGCIRCNTQRFAGYGE